MINISMVIGKNDNYLFFRWFPSKMYGRIAGNKEIFKVDTACLLFLQKKVDLVVKIKKFENLIEKLQRTNVNGLNSLIKI